MRVVVVEGCDPVRLRLASMVRDCPGAELAGEAAGTPKAFALIEREHPSVAIIGNRLSDASGFDLLRDLGPELRPMQVILLCEQIDAPYLFRARGLGVDYVLETPRDLEFLPRLLRYLGAAGRAGEPQEIRA